MRRVVSSNDFSRGELESDVRNECSFQSFTSECSIVHRTTHLYAKGRKL